MELLKSKIKERHFQVSRQKEQVIYKAKGIRLTQNFSSAALKSNSAYILREKDGYPGISHPAEEAFIC